MKIMVRKSDRATPVVTELDPLKAVKDKYQTATPKKKRAFKNSIAKNITSGKTSAE